MSKIVTIHQPNYLPYAGFFSKVKRAHTLIILDTALFSKNSTTNRNKIRTPSGWMYLTIPIEKRFHQKPIVDVELPKNKKWMSEHWKSIIFNYNRSKHFEEYKDFFEEVYSSPFTMLSELNLKLIDYLFDKFKISTDIVKSSEFNIDAGLHKTDFLIELLKKINADTYLSGKSGQDYLDMDKFKENGIEVEFQQFVHPIYEQQFTGFVPNLSSIDLLFNVGKESYKLI